MMKRFFKTSARIATIVLVIMSMSRCLGETVLPKLSDVFGMSVPTIFDITNIYPEQITEETDGSKSYSWKNIMEDDFTLYSKKLLDTGFELIDYKTEDNVFSATIGKEGRSFAFSYDSVQKTAIINLPTGLYNDKLENAEQSYDDALDQYNSQNYSEARVGFFRSGIGYKQRETFMQKITSRLKDKVILCWKSIYALNADGKVYCDGSDTSYDTTITTWKDIVAISGDSSGIVGLKSDGNVVTAGDAKHIKTNQFKNLVQVCLDGYPDFEDLDNNSYYMVGLRKDGKVVAAGDNSCGQCDVQKWSNIIAVKTVYNYYDGNFAHGTIGIKDDGTVVTAGFKNADRRVDLSNWTDIVDIVSSYDYNGRNMSYKDQKLAIVGLKSDGSVIASLGEGSLMDFSGWTNIIALSSPITSRFIVGLKADGTVVATGADGDGRCDVQNWTDVVSIATSSDCTVGLRADGTVLVAGKAGSSSYKDWTDIGEIFVCDDRIVGIHHDGTIEATHSYYYKNALEWKMW